MTNLINNINHINSERIVKVIAIAFNPINNKTEHLEFLSATKDISKYLNPALFYSLDIYSQNQDKLLHIESYNSKLQEDKSK